MFTLCLCTLLDRISFSVLLQIHYVYVEIVVLCLPASPSLLLLLSWCFASEKSLTGVQIIVLLVRSIPVLSVEPVDKQTSRN